MPRTKSERGPIRRGGDVLVQPTDLCLVLLEESIPNTERSWRRVPSLCREVTLESPLHTVYLMPKHRSKSKMRAASLFKKADLSEIGLNMQDCTSPRCEEVQWRAKQVWVMKHVRSNGCITRLSLCTHACALHVTGIPSAIWRRSRYTREERVGMNDRPTKSQMPSRSTCCD